MRHAAQLHKRFEENPADLITCTLSSKGFPRLRQCQLSIHDCVPCVLPSHYRTAFVRFVMFRVRLQGEEAHAIQQTLR